MYKVQGTFTEGWVSVYASSVLKSQLALLLAELPHKGGVCLAEMWWDGRVGVSGFFYTYYGVDV